MPANALATTLRDQALNTERFPSYREARRLVLFAAAYLAAYGYGFLFPESTSSPLWFPDSVLLCALLLAPRKQWWLYIAVALTIRFIPALHPPVPGWFVVATSANDMLKGLLAAYLLLRIARGSVGLSSLREFTAYLGIAVFLVPVCSAFGGAAARQALGYEFWPAWNQWFLGNALANLVLTPTLLYWCSRRFREVSAPLLEIFLWMVGFGLSLYCVVFLNQSDYSRLYVPLALYAPIPFLIWAAARFGTIGASSALSFIALLSMVGTVRAEGPFSAGLASHNVLFVQLFLAVMSVPVLFVAILIEERTAVEKQLRESQESLRNNYERARDLAGKLISAQEDERKRVARDLHDDIGQRLSLLVMKLDRFGSELPARMTRERKVLSDVRRDTEEVLTDLHGLSHQLHASTLQHLGLSQGLRGLCRAISQQHHIVVDMHVDELPSLSQDLSLCLFRVAQEALNNAARHGRAKQVSVQLLRKSDSLRLEVRDAGVGFDPAAPYSGLGLVSMRERLRMVGGTLALTSAPGQGTVIAAVVRIERATAAAAAN